MAAYIGAGHLVQAGGVVPRRAGKLGVAAGLAIGLVAAVRGGGPALAGEDLRHGLVELVEQRVGVLLALLRNRPADPEHPAHVLQRLLRGLCALARVEGGLGCGGHARIAVVELADELDEELHGVLALEQAARELGAQAHAAELALKVVPEIGIRLRSRPLETSPLPTEPLALRLDAQVAEHQRPQPQVAAEAGEQLLRDEPRLGIRRARRARAHVGRRTLGEAGVGLLRRRQILDAFGDGLRRLLVPPRLVPERPHHRASSSSEPKMPLRSVSFNELWTRRSSSTMRRRCVSASSEAL